MRFHMSTRQTSAFVSLVDAIRDITPDLSIAVTPDGLRMRKTAMHDAMLVSFNMPVSNFDEFKCEGAGVLEWPCEVLASVLHTSVITDALAISYDHTKAKHRAIIRLTSKTSCCVREYHLPVCYDPNVPAVIRPRDPYHNIVHMHTKQLMHLIQNLLPFTPSFTIEAGEAHVRFGFANNTNTFVARGQVTCGDRPCAQEGGSVGKVSRAAFQSAHMSVLAKCLQLHPVCNMYIRDDAPMVIEVFVNELGTFKVALTPIEQQ